MGFTQSNSYNKSFLVSIKQREVSGKQIYVNNLVLIISYMNDSTLGVSKSGFIQKLA